MFQNWNFLTRNVRFVLFHSWLDLSLGINLKGKQTLHLEKNYFVCISFYVLYPSYNNSSSCSRKLIDLAYTPFHAILKCGHLTADVQVFPRPEPFVVDEEIDPIPKVINTGNFQKLLASFFNFTIQIYSTINNRVLCSAPTPHLPPTYPLIKTLLLNFPDFLLLLFFYPIECRKKYKFLTLRWSNFNGLPVKSQTSLPV